MAVFTGTASGHVDLLNKIVGHLTDAGAMGSQVWQLLLSRTVAGDPVTQGSMEERYLKGPGLAGADAIYINIRSYQNVGSDYYNWYIRGAINHNAALPFDTQPGSSPWCTKLLWNSAIPYTLVANGRRFIIIAKVSTTYANTYCGFYLPYATSAEMPYPIFVGSNGMDSRRWSATNYVLGSFYDPVTNTTTFPSTTASAWLRHFDGNWIPVANYYDSSGSRAERDNCIIWPWQTDYLIGPDRANSYPVLPAILNSSYSGANTYGELQGVYFTPGIGNASENTLAIAGKTYLVTQSSQRTTRRDYAAILLE